MQNSLEIVSEGMLEIICVSAHTDSQLQKLNCKRRSSDGFSGDRNEDSKPDQSRSKGSADRRLSPETPNKKLKLEHHSVEKSTSISCLNDCIVSKAIQSEEKEITNSKIYPGPSNEELKQKGDTLDGKTSSEVWSGMKDLPAMVWGPHNTTMTLEERAKFLAEPPEWTEAVRKVLSFLNDPSATSKE